jgi:hypothetical protein
MLSSNVYATSWWNNSWQFSTNITNINNDAFAHTQENVRILFNHGGHASYATKCSDIRVVNPSGVEIISTNANTSAGKGQDVLRCDATYAEVIYNVTLPASTSVNYTIYYGASGVGNASYTKYPFYWNDTFDHYTSGYPLNTALNGTYYVTNGSLGATSLGNATWNTTGGGYAGLQANVYSKTGGESSAFIWANNTNFTLIPNQSVNISFTWETFSKTSAATSRVAAIFNFLTTKNTSTNQMDGYAIWQRQGDLNKNRLFRVFNINRSDADYTADPHPTPLNLSYFDVNNVYGEKYKKWGYTISIWNASAISNGNVNFTVDMYIDENGGNGGKPEAGGLPNMTYYVVDYDGYPKVGSFSWGAWAYTDGGAAPTQGWSKVKNITITSSNYYNSSVFYNVGSEVSLASWSTPVANLSSGLIGNGISFNSTFSYIGGTLYNVTAVFNNTAYTPTLVSGTTYTYSATLPNVLTTTSIPYYYSAYLLIDGVVYNYSSPVGYVTTNTVNISDCSIGTQALRFDVYNEENPLSSVYTNFYGTFKVYSSYPNTFSTYNVTGAGNRTHFVCIYPAIASGVIIDADIRYDNESYYYPPRYYFMRNAVIDNVTDQINLYILNSTYATNIQFMVINSNNIPQADILVNVQRFYESEGVYRSVAMGMTADDGYTNIRLRPYDIYYRPIVSRNGTVLRTFTPIVLTTVQNILTISEDLVSGYWKYNKNIMHSCGFNNVTNILQCDAVVTTGESLLFKMEAWEILPVSTDTICLKEATGSAVTLLCDLGNMTGRKFTAKFWAVMDTNHDLLDELSWDLDITGMFGVYGLLFMAMFIMAMVMVSLFNPAVALIACLIGIMIGLSMNLMTISNPAIISLILVIIIGLYKVRS